MNAQVPISIVIPAYNEELLLQDCLASLAKQKASVSFEVIVVVTSNVDTSLPIVQSMVPVVPYSLRAVIETRRGICFARQAGCEQVQGDIIVSTDADITYPSHWVENIWQAFQVAPKPVAVSGAFIFEKKPRWAFHVFNGLFRLTKWYSRLFGSPLYVAAMNFAFTKKALSQIGGYNTALNQAGDEYDVLRRLRRIGRVQYLPHNPVYASNRRFRRNIIYSFFVTFLYYYVGEYLLARLFGRSLIGPAPAIREKE